MSLPTNTTVTYPTPSNWPKSLSLHPDDFGRMFSEYGSSVTITYSDTSSFQPVAVDLTLGAAAGGTTGKFIAPFMGHLLDDGSALTKAGNYLGGGIFHYGCTSGSSTTYPEGACLAGIDDGVSDTHVNAFVAYIDGDSSTTIANAAFKVMTNNSTAASGFHFGLDLQDAAHDSYQPVDSAFYLSAPIRIVEDICLLAGTATPTNGTSGTGVGVAGPGSLHLNTSDGKLRTNTNTKASPTWTIVGTQS